MTGQKEEKKEKEKKTKEEKKGGRGEEGEEGNLMRTGRPDDIEGSTRGPPGPKKSVYHCYD